jgi:hypothetical protein
MSEPVSGDIPAMAEMLKGSWATPRKKVSVLYIFHQIMPPSQSRERDSASKGTINIHWT